MTLCAKKAVNDAVAFGNAITPSVLAIARLTKVSPDVLAANLQDEEANAKYLGSVVSALVPVFIKKAIDEAHEAKVSKK